MLAIVGGATAVGKLLDEAFESAQGYQRQTAGEIAKDAAWEGVFGATGEGVGRGLYRHFSEDFLKVVDLRQPKMPKKLVGR